MTSIRSIKSRASTKSRLRLGQLPIVVGTPPVMISPPELDGYWLENYYAYGVILMPKIAPGMTLVASPGTWDDSDGETTVVGRFYLTGTPLGNPGDTELVVSENWLGSYIIYVVEATRGGVTYRQMSRVNPEVVNTTTTLAQWSSGGTPPAQFARPGVAAVKPVYAWNVTAEFGSYTTHGEWYKNGIATGITTETYADTVEGDVVCWYEWITNGDDISSYAPQGLKNTGKGGADYGNYKTIVNEKAALAIELSKAGIDERLDGIVGGATSMEVFSTKDPVNGIYVVNENCWMRDLYSQLACVGAGFHGRSEAPTGLDWQQPYGWTSSYGPTLITPRHILTSGHTQFHNCDGSPRNYTVRWVLEDGTIVEAKVIGGHKYQDNNGACSANPFHGNSVSLLDRDVQALGVHVVPVIDLSDVYDAIYPANVWPEWFGRSQSAADRFGPHQVEAYKSYSLQWDQGRNKVFSVAEDYPVLHENMFWAPRDGVSYYYFGGDSGTPMFNVVNDTVFLEMILSGAVTNRDPWISELDTMILEGDTLAVATGRLDALTGYTVTRCADFTNPNLLLIREGETDIAILMSEEDPTYLFALPN